MSTETRCGLCLHEKADHPNGCDVRHCRCERFIPWDSMARNLPDYTPEEKRIEQAERVAGARANQLRRQLGAVLQSDLLVQRLVNAAQGEPQIQSRIVEVLIESGLEVVNDPTSSTQPTRSITRNE